MEDSFDVWEKRKKTIIQMPYEPCPVTEIPWGSNCAVGQTFVVLLDMQYHCTFLSIVVWYAHAICFVQ